VLEARDRTGGRCLTLRTGDTLTEDVDSELFDSKRGATQVVRFERPLGDAEPYLNAGPGRIPSSHKRLLSYLQHFRVELEVYIMNSGSNLVQMEGGPFDSHPIVYRQLDHNTRGWLAQMVYENADSLLEGPDKQARVEQLRKLMVAFGELTGEGKYQPTAGENALHKTQSRAGWELLPGVAAGEIAPPIDFDTLLQSEFWDKTRFYQPVDFLWQMTTFQPIGGMDRVPHAFAQQVAALGGTIHLNSPVKSIDWDAHKREFVVQVSQIGTKAVIEYRADYCFCNLAMPFLSRILSDHLQGPGEHSGFEADFKAGLRAVYAAQFEPTKAPDEDGYVARFLATTTKVGWQADRRLWQGSGVTTQKDPLTGDEVLDVVDSEIGVVPIFGGISWTDDDITQVWYPSGDFHGRLGVITGAYNFSKIAWRWGRIPIRRRLSKARQGAKLFGEAFGAGLHAGVAIAWQNMAHIKGGWAQWHTVENAVAHFNVLVQGSGIYDGLGKLSDPVFFIIGDQISSLPGWQEGAIASSLNALSRLARPDLQIQALAALPDTRLMVEGV
jgi:monoamine oxidase